MNKTFKEFIILLIVVLITIFICIGLLKIINTIKIKNKEKEVKKIEFNLNWKLT